MDPQALTDDEASTQPQQAVQSSMEIESVAGRSCSEATQKFDYILDDGAAPEDEGVGHRQVRQLGFLSLCNAFRNATKCEDELLGLRYAVEGVLHRLGSVDEIYFVGTDEDQPLPLGFEHFLQICSSANPGSRRVLTPEQMLTLLHEEVCRAQSPGFHGLNVIEVGAQTVPDDWKTSKIEGIRFHHVGLAYLVDPRKASARIDPATIVSHLSQSLRPARPPSDLPVHLGHPID